MKQNSDPIEFLIEFAWANGADRFVVNNAKDELRSLREKAQDSDRWISCERELANLKKMLNQPVAYGRINDRLDLYDLRIQNNPYNHQEDVVPLYSNREEFLSGDWKGYANYGKFTK